jgi:uncharacterized membrane protein
MIVEILVETLAYLLPWRAWLCLIVALVLAILLHAYGIWFVWPSDIFVVLAILGIVVGVYWHQRVG